MRCAQTASASPCGAPAGVRMRRRSAVGEAAAGCGGAATLHGPLTWRGGTLRGTWNIPDDGALVLDAGSARTLAARSARSRSALPK